MDVRHDPSWYDEFAADDRAAIEHAIPLALHLCQERSARAQQEWADPDGDQDVYGVGMSRGAPKELAAQLKGLSSYRDVRIAGTRRSLILVDEKLLFLHRVGKLMPRKYQHIRLPYLPDSRRELFSRTSDRKHVPQGLFELEQPEDDVATFSDVLAVLGRAAKPDTLYVPYYSSTPAGIGAIYWGPARLVGHYLEFTQPRRLAYVSAPTAVEAPPVISHIAGGFADGRRPRTATKLRPRPSQHEGS
ncbi:hypothetical protein [Actinotalea fermentans]|uniref:Uncharacterized protein n=1 Tax=Actinotalea fermentans TaxID=43671 RepID=A0A511YYH3_9CELL|nr:hypothetical protein [Actinotalea fermentans]KGM17851.1 hypothetical protein N867_08830 [Actinotalea fermentans ATCC 43279 = JCM 9966 = DSM 3133]GEN80250.1 hypothetical protein AFE02nite_19840 [Actinotalea fermentans]